MSDHQRKDAARRVEYPMRVNAGIAFAWAMIHLALAFGFTVSCGFLISRADGVLNLQAFGAVLCGISALSQIRKVSQLKALTVMSSGYGR